MTENSYAIRGLHYEIERPRHSLSFSYEFENDKRTGTSREADNTTQEYKEILDIETGGWLVYPRLLTFSLRISPEWEQTREHNDNELFDKTRTFLLGYDTNITLLPYKPYTITLFANRLSSTVSTTFAARSKIESDTYGAGLNLKYDVLPTQINYQRQESTQTGFFTSDSESDKLKLVMNYDRHLGESQLTSEYSEESTFYTGTAITTKNQNVKIRNKYDFSKKVFLSSNYAYNESRNPSSVTRRYNVKESLDWTHREDLRTRYSFRYDDISFGTARLESAELGFNLTTLLLKDLTTSFSASGSSSRSSGLRERIYGTGLSLNYKKGIPWGTFNIATSHGYSINDRQVDSKFEQVVDEPVTLTTGTVTRLKNKDADSNSIVVTDLTGTVVYIKDVHYRVREVNAFVEISRIPVVVHPIPAIPDGDTVLIDYIFQINATFDFSSFNQSYQADLFLWSAWRVYYGFKRSTQRILSGTATEEPSDDTVHTAGTDYTWKWSKTEAIYENMQTSDFPSERFRINETISLSPSETTFFAISGGYGVTKFKDTGETNRFYDINSSLGWLPTRRLSLSVEGFHNERTGEIVKTTDTGFSSLFQYVLGIWRVSTEYRFENSKDLITNEEIKNNLIQFQLQRSMF
jgi:hypothetical protein